MGTKEIRNAPMQSLLLSSLTGLRSERTRVSRIKTLGYLQPTALFQTKRFECRIDMLEMNVERAKSIDLRCGKPRGDFRFAFHVLGKCPLAFPSFHSRALHCFVCAFAFYTCAREREQDRLAEIQTLCHSEILPHPLGINVQVFHKVAQFHQHVIEENARIGQNDSFRA